MSPLDGPPSVQFLDLWWHHFGQHYLPGEVKTVAGLCKYCGAHGVVRAEDPVCPRHFSYTSKKPIGVDNKVSAPQPGHAIVLSPEQGFYFTNLKLPHGCTAEVRSKLDWTLFKARLIVDQVLKPPFIVAEVSRRHADMFASCVPTMSYRRLHVASDSCVTVDAHEIRNGIQAIGQDFPLKTLREMARHRRTLAVGATAGEAYIQARKSVREQLEKTPSLAALVSLDRARPWPIEPGTATWETLMRTLYALQKETLAEKEAA